MSESFHWDCDKRKETGRVELKLRVSVRTATAKEGAARCGCDARARPPHTMRLCGCCIG